MLQERVMKRRRPAKKKLLGLPIQTNEAVLPDTVVFTVGGRVVGRIVNIKLDDPEPSPRAGRVPNRA